jgi:co-chaperonin GroES (HSP10)
MEKNLIEVKLDSDFSNDNCFRKQSIDDCRAGGDAGEEKASVSKLAFLKNLLKRKKITEAIEDLKFNKDLVVIKPLNITPKSGLDLTMTDKTNLSADSWEDHAFQGIVVGLGKRTNLKDIRIRIGDRILYNPSYRYYEFVHKNKSFLMLERHSIIAKCKLNEYGEY